MITINTILPILAKKYKKDKRVMNVILRHPFLFLSNKIEDNEDKDIRLRYLGTFKKKRRYSNGN